jgi:DNA-binding transcriptional LysR family regulator
MVVPLPEEAVRPYVEAGLLTVLVKQLGVEIDAFGLITRRNHKLSPGAEVMIAALKEAAEELY